MPKIFIDPGHGGADGGAQGNGLSEKELTLAISKRIKANLQNYKDTTVIMSRDTDTTKSLSERTKDANLQGVDVYVSIHINAHTTAQPNGFESFIYNGNVNQATISLQNVLHAEVMKDCSFFEDRGKKRQNFHVLRETAMVAILTENGFITNSKDAKNLKDEAQIDKIAKGHTDGLVKFYGLQLKERAPISKPATNTAKKLFKVQVGAFSEQSNAEALAKKLKADGYNTYIVEE